jgi:transcriptional regulator with XRE-family HTH domain
MKVTSDVKTAIINGLSAKGMRMAQLAEKIGRTRSWVSKLLSDEGGIADLSDELVDAISDVIERPIRPVYAEGGRVSASAARLSELAEKDPVLAGLLDTLLAACAPESKPYIPIVHQKELIKVGAEVTRIVHRWETPDNPHYGKIGAEVLDYLRRYFEK